MAVEGHIGTRQKGIYPGASISRAGAGVGRYDEANLVSAAGLLPAAELAQTVGLAELVEARVEERVHP